MLHPVSTTCVFNRNKEKKTFLYEIIFNNGYWWGGEEGQSTEYQIRFITILS